MSGIGPSELIVLVVVGLLILGPERLPRVATQIGRWVGRARRTANQLRYQLEREITLADIEGKKKEKEKEREKQAAKSTESASASGSDEAQAAGTTDSNADSSDAETGSQTGSDTGADTGADTGGDAGSAPKDEARTD